NLVTFLEGDWQNKVDRGLFIEEGEVSPGGVPTKDTFVSWVKEAKHYEKFGKDPRDSWIAKEMRRELESAQLTGDQKRRLDELAKAMGQLEKLPGVMKYKDTIERGMASVDPGIRDLHFGVFFAQNWKQLCSDYKEWFAAFFEDTNDSGRREQWQKDAHLKGVLAVRDKVKPERHDPRQIAKRPDASYEELAAMPSDDAKSREGSEKTKEAWQIVQEVKNLLIRLPVKADLSQRAKGFEGCGLRDRSRHLASLVESFAPGKTGYPPPDISQKIDKVIPVAERLQASWEKISGKCAEIGRLREKIRGEGERWRGTLVASFDGSFAADTHPRQDPCSEEDLTNLQQILEELVVHAEQIDQRCQTIHGERETIKRCGEKVLAGFDTCLVGKVAVGASPSDRENLKGLAEMLGQVTGTVGEIARLCTRIRADQQTIENGGIIQDKDKTWRSKVLTKFGAYVDAEVSSVTMEEARRDLEELKGRLGQVESTAGKLAGFVKAHWPTEVARELFIDEGEVPLPDTGVPAKETFESWLERAKDYYKLKRDPRASWTPERRVEAIGKAIAALPPTDSRREKNEGSLKEAEAQIRTVRGLPAIERSREQIEETVQTVGLRLGQIEFDLFFAEKWQGVCLAYEGWFEKFLSDTADQARQERWQKDAYLKAVLAMRGKVKPEDHPRKIANRSDMSLLELAKNPSEEAKSPDGRDSTKAALELIKDIESRFQSGDWAVSKSVAALSEVWRERKWAKPAAHLKSLVEAVKPGPKLVAAVDEILAFEEQTRKEIESRWKSIDDDRKVIKASGSKVLSGFDDYIEAEAGSAGDLEGLKTRLEEVGSVAGNLVTFLEGDWQNKVDRALFIKEGEVSPGGVPTKDTFVSWLEEAKLYEKFGKDPRDSWIAKEMRRELENAQLTEDQKRRLDELATAMDALEKLPGVVKYKDTIERGMASVDPGIRDLHFGVFFAENWKQLCSDYEEWFAAFFEDTKDSGRREQWQKDAHLKGVLAVRDKVN
ncbi:hypothetical protein HQ563_18620, partial [bacterium]|nr:hypothetical protein [bacterium]